MACLESTSPRQTLTQSLNIAVIGGGWAGLAAAITAIERGHRVSLFEASRVWGGRARAIEAPAAGYPSLDNGQHILIGAYRQTLTCMQTVGIDLDSVLWRLPLNLKNQYQQGLALADWPFPFNLIAGIAGASAWRLQDKLSLLRASWRWQRMKFECDDTLTVADLCRGVSPTVWRDLIEPLCVSALNTPAHEASGRVFLRVMNDALFGPPGSSDVLLPKVDLGQLFPQAAIQWLQARGARCHLGTRIQALTHLPNLDTTRPGTWRVESQEFDHVVLATPAKEAARCVAPFNLEWTETAQQLTHEAIATVYIQAPMDFKLPQPMLALKSSESWTPADGPQNVEAQFVFDRGLMYPEAKTPGLLAFVASATRAEKTQLESAVMRQAEALIATLRPTSQQTERLSIVQTVIEKRATFACTPGLRRPTHQPCVHLSVCGDYVVGPYPATLEGAVMSGVQAIP